MTVTGYKKKKLAKKYYDLEFSLFQNGKKIKISENFQDFKFFKSLISLHFVQIQINFQVTSILSIGDPNIIFVFTGANSI